MADQVTFGRRTRPGAVPAPAAPPPRQPAAAGPRPYLTPEAEAFRAELRGGPARASVERWSGAQQRKSFLLWGLRVALMFPGLLAFALHLTPALSIGLEAAGFVANGWLRRTRKRHRAAILAWEEDGPR